MDPIGSLPFSRRHLVFAPLDSTQHFSCYAFETSTGKFFRYRFSADGTLDPPFTNGLETSIQYPSPVPNLFGVDRSQRVWSWHREPADHSMTVRRWQTDGPQDTTFGSNGVVTVPPPDNDIGNPDLFLLGLTPSGVLYIQEHSMSSQSNVLLRVGPDGWDESFGTRGRLPVVAEETIPQGLLVERP